MSEFDWSLYPRAESFLQGKVAEFFGKHKSGADLVSTIEKGSSTSAFDWIDHMTIPLDGANLDELADLGFKESHAETPNCESVYRVEGSTLFPVLLGQTKKFGLALHVDSLDKFQAIYALSNKVEGEISGSLRKMDLGEENGCLLSIVERNGSSSFVPEGAGDVENYRDVLRAFESRKRVFDSDEEGLRETLKLIKGLASKVDSRRLANGFFSVERAYWQSRNAAGKVQKSRQDALGLGWGNMDHHTFRSSRSNFKDLIALFEAMGLRSRERFHAGAQAGWGAQILEDEVGRVVVFADVDLDAEERETDFAHQGLEPREKLGTVGLWVALHGESTLQAGMHHLAARFSFDKVTEDLKQKDVGMMKPFSSFPFLKQAFTEGEKWRPEKMRVSNLENSGQLSHELAAKFTENGALGSHLENIQRKQGFKGFNQQSVSAIIKWTDPRLQKEIYA